MKLNRLTSFSIMLAMLSFPFMAISQGQGGQIVQTSSKGKPELVTFDASNRIGISQKDQLLKQVLSLKSGDHMQELSALSDDIGYTHYKYQQYYNGVKVEFGTYTLHAQNDQIESASGAFIPVKNISTTPSLKENQALLSAISYIGADKYMWDIPSEEQLIKEDKQDASATYFPKGELVIVEDYLGNMEPRLAWKFDIYASQPLSRDHVYVDAENGKILLVNPLIHHTNATGTAATRYSGSRSITTDSYNGSYRLRETRGTNSGIQTYNLNKGTNYGSATDFTDNDNNWTSGEWNNANKDNAALDAHWGAEKTYDYWISKHNRNSFDNNGGIIKSYVHYSTNYDNAFWDGSRMTYGDGGTYFTPLTSIDVCGHEIGHGVCSYTANLVYSNESGAINEGLSDIWGACIEQYAAPEKSEWLMGEDIVIGGGALRYMNNPNQASDPDTYGGTYWYTGTSDNGGVHTNSGVINYWFYLLSAGGSGTNDIGNAFTVAGVGMDTAAKVTYRAESVYMTSSTNYAAARNYTIQAASDLYGANSAVVIAVTNAWYAVGVGGQYGTCQSPLGLNASNITTTSATVGWSAASGATAYNLQYKTAAASAWNTIANLTGTSYNLTGLTSNTAYNFRVRTTCTAPDTSAYSATASFTTSQVGGCTDALEPNNTFSTAATITTGTAVNALIASNTDLDYYSFTISATSNLTIALTNLAADYDMVLYNASGTQLGISQNSNTTNESISYTNAAAGTYKIYIYGWNGAYSSSICYNLLATATPVGGGSCTNNYESNNTSSTATSINVATNINSMIATSSDVDWFKFNNTSSQKNIKVTLTNLPADYEINLYASNGTTLLGTSQNSGTTSEQIIYNNTSSAGTYRIKVYPYNGANSNTACYTLRADISSTAYINGFGGEEESNVTIPESNGDLVIYPNPARQLLNIMIPAGPESDAQLTILNEMGQEVENMTVGTNQYNTQLRIDLNDMVNGIYFVRVVREGKMTMKRFVIAK